MSPQARTGLIAFGIAGGLLLCGGGTAGLFALLHTSRDWVRAADEGNNLHGSKGASLAGKPSAGQEG
jgi:hypothetical protein